MFISPASRKTIMLEKNIGGILINLIVTIPIKIQKRNSSNIIPYFHKNISSKIIYAQGWIY